MGELKRTRGWPYTRVYVFGQAEDEQGAVCVMKDLDRVWATLHGCGCGSYGETNTVLIDVVRHAASHQHIVYPVKRWRPSANVMDDTNPINPDFGRQILARYIGDGADVEPWNVDPRYVDSAAFSGADYAYADSADKDESYCYDMAVGWDGFDMAMGWGGFALWA